MLTDPPQIWWIRHGESDSNAGARTASAAAPVLTELGWQQARAVPSAFERAPDLVVTSPFIRTKQTAQPLLERFPRVCQEEWPIQEFTELSFANRNGTSGLERLPLLEEYWSRLDPDYLDGEGAETFRDLITRVEATVERMRRLEGFTAIFGHGLFMRAMLWWLLAQPERVDGAAMRRYALFHDSLWIPNCAIVRMQVQQDGLFLSPPDVRHLAHIPVTRANESEA
jgi:broad specificity phosphatase PhoE